MAEQIQTGAPAAGLNEQVRQEHQLGVGISQSSTSATAHTTAGSKISNPKARSIVWDHFTKLSIEQANGEEKAKCHHCKSEFLCNSTSHGTNGMLKHLKRRHKWIFVEKNQSLIGVTEGEESAGGRKTTVSISYNTEEIRKALAIFVIEDEMPFSVVEGRGFRYFVNRLEPRFKVPSRRTITRDCYQLFLDEKSRLKEFLKKSCVRPCLTTDCWTSIQNISYMCLTTHFIDEHWRLQKRILNFSQIDNHKGETIGKEIDRCLREWGIENVFTITVDNASSNDVAISYLKRKLKNWNGLVCEGEYMHMRCVAHILNLIVNDGLKDLNPSIVPIRNVIRYVRSSPQRLQKFKQAAHAEKISSGASLCFDVPTRWNSTYIMLEHAIPFQKAFERLEDEDEGYVTWFKDDRQPSSLDWDNARAFIQFLKLFYEVTLALSGSLHVTANCAFDEIQTINELLVKWSENEADSILGTMACNMRNKFDKYWGKIENINPLIYIGIVLDPWYKLEYVNFICDANYEIGTATLLKKKIASTLWQLYNFYAQESHKVSQTSDDSASHEESVITKEGLADMGWVTIAHKKERKNQWKRLKLAQECPNTKNDLEKYLACDVVDDGIDDLDILSWWKENSVKYSVLSHLARDVLAIPVSTVASESCFSTGGRVLDVFRSSLSPKMVEALICTQNWLNPNEYKIQEVFDEFQANDAVINEISVAMTSVTNQAIQEGNRMSRD
ncbi:hypothetical protein L6164_012213 [Bauhinia variegata]|uniref:Uncharacterized protein n=1 Tax=Bauhinia variegata TaxID=167791 RepID=A0ACB9P995_BAUVA|nr:hypothetical protein L6164_012213 [Bauhinia variegata]